jgi:hypothetical protein
MGNAWQTSNKGSFVGEVHPLFVIYWHHEQQNLQMAHCDIMILILGKGNFIVIFDDCESIIGRFASSTAMI